MLVFAKMKYQYRYLQQTFIVKTQKQTYSPRFQQFLHSCLYIEFYVKITKQFIFTLQLYAQTHS